jgi:hypothetical protein
MSFIECQQSIFPCIGCQNVCFRGPKCATTSSVAAWIRTIFTMESRRLTTQDIWLILQIQVLCCVPRNQAKLLIFPGLSSVSWPAFPSTRIYCSNHEVTLRELVASQRSLSSWPLYETGIEALARSIRAIDHRRGSNKRAMTVGDLLMSPIQRLTKYPLLFADLHQSTPVIDCPVSYAEMGLTFEHLRKLAREANHVTDDHVARERIQKCWLLQDRLAPNDETLQASQFRMLGHPILCGVLHLAYQTKQQVKGGYGLCILFEKHLVMAVPAEQAEEFDVVTIIHLSDLKMESASDGEGNPTRIICGCH